VIQPNPQGILYHYCDAQAAQSIISEGKVWLSSFSLSNDSREGRVGQDAIVAAAMAYSARPHETDHIKRQMKTVDLLNGCYGMCFSTHDDKLSQWRGYADDGSGFAIGFKADMRNWLDCPYVEDKVPRIHDERIRLQPVQYTIDEQHQTASRIFKEIEPYLKSLPMRETGFPGPIPTSLEQLNAEMSTGETLLATWPEIYTMKSDAFEEESEWRAIALVYAYQHGFKFRVAKGKVIPYIEHFLPMSREKNPIREIILGPRNNTPRHIVQMMLARNEMMNDVEIRPSAASYR
jgi:hypothetical protein